MRRRRKHRVWDYPPCARRSDLLGGEQGNDACDAFQLDLHRREDGDHQIGQGPQNKARRVTEARRSVDENGFRLHRLRDFCKQVFEGSAQIEQQISLLASWKGRHSDELAASRASGGIRDTACRSGRTEGGTTLPRLSNRAGFLRRGHPPAEAADGPSCSRIRPVPALAFFRTPPIGSEPTDPCRPRPRAGPRVPTPTQCEPRRDCGLYHPCRHRNRRS